MTSRTIKRKLAAIVAADVAGYSRLMGTSSVSRSTVRDIIVGSDDFYGDGTNVAARLEALRRSGRADRQEHIPFYGVFGLTGKDIASLPKGEPTIKSCEAAESAPSERTTAAFRRYPATVFDPDEGR
jgi:hypothetical protein